MFNSFYPDEWIDSVYSYDFKKLYDEGYRGIIFDIDNTLVCHGAPQNEQSLNFFDKLGDIGFNFFFLSNNKEPRVKTFAEPVGARYIYKAGKPVVKNYLRACDMMNLDKNQVLFIGDQLFTDVYGAKRAGIRNILVKPIDKHEEIQIVLKRKLERIVLFFYVRRTKHNG